MSQSASWPVWVLTTVLPAIVLSGCATVARRAANDYGIKACPPGAAGALLSTDALQCWFAARRGRWRTLSQESHFDVLVVRVEAFDVRDAEDIARRFVAGQPAFSEILVYVRPETSGARSRIRRVQWTRAAGFDTLDFVPPE